MKTCISIMLLTLITAPSALATGFPHKKLGNLGARVYWDVSHGIYQDNHPDGHYSLLKETLQTRGFSVETGADGVLHTDLSAFSVLVVNLTSAWDSPYTAAEVEQITTFVQSGGALLMLADAVPAHLPNIEPVAAAFGLSFAGIVFTNDLYTSLFAPWPPLAGIQSLRFPVVEAFHILPPLEARVWSPDMEIVVASGQFGQGLVVAVGDTSMFGNVYLESEDNLPFAEQLFDHLIAARVPTLGPLGLFLFCLSLVVAGTIVRWKQNIRSGSSKTI